MAEGGHGHCYWSAACEEVVVDGCDVVAGHGAVAVNVGIVFPLSVACQEVVVDAGDIGAGHCSVAVHVEGVIALFLHLIGHGHREEAVAAGAGEGDLGGRAAPVGVARVEAGGAGGEALLGIEAVEVDARDGSATGGLEREGVATGGVEGVLVLIVGRPWRTAARYKSDVAHCDVAVQIGGVATGGRGQSQLCQCLGRAEVEDGSLGDRASCRAQAREECEKVKSFNHSLMSLLLMFCCQEG